MKPAAEIEHEIRVTDALHVSGSELDVVRLDPGRREVDHDVATAGDLLRRPGEWIERGNDRPLTCVLVSEPPQLERSSAETMSVSRRTARTLARL